MSEASSQVLAWSFGLAAVVFAAFGLHLWMGWKGARRGWFLLVAVGCSALWALAALFFGQYPSAESWSLDTLLDSVRQAAWITFLFSLLTPDTGALPPALARVRRVVLSVVALRAVMEVLVASGFGSANLAGMVTIGLAVASAVAGLVGIEQVFRNFPIESRWGIKPLCLGLAAAFFFDLYVFAEALLYRRIDLQLWSARGIAHAMTVPLVAISASRSRDWDFRIALSRDAVFHSTALALAGAFLLVVAAAGYWVRYFGGEWGRVLQTSLLFMGLLVVGIALFSGAFRARLRVFLAKHLFRYRYDYREEWLRVTQALMSTGSSADLPAAVIRALADLVESPGGLMWMRDRTGTLVCRGRLNHELANATVSSDSDFARFLMTRGWIVDLEQLRSQPSLYDGLMVPEWLAEVPDAWLIVPLAGSDEVIGFVVLLTARARIDIDWEVLDLLKTAARQAAVHLAREQAIEALLEAQKFDSFNKMSAFVVHDLKNLVAQLQLMLRNADRHAGNPEFQQDMIDTVRHVQERMTSLMKQLQEKRSIDPRRPVDMLDVAERIARSKRHQSTRIRVDGEGGASVMAHPERFERVIGHLVQNALDASKGDGIVSLSIHPGEDEVGIEVCDEGAGMSQQFIRERLFKPFQTTKDAGMGIGAYEAHQYVSELGGRIDVESEPGRGTRMTVWLPRALGTERVVTAA
jgi:putative PEP-CTERM system histidine kinase